MKLEELYIDVNGNYEEVVSRFGGSEAMVNKFVHRFLDDHSIDDCNSEDLETAFRGSHTMKGICLNLGFQSLFEISNELTEKLRPLEKVDYKDLLNKLNKEYERIVSLIKEVE